MFSLCCLTGSQLRDFFSTVHGSACPVSRIFVALFTQMFLAGFFSWLVSSSSQTSVGTGLLCCVFDQYYRQRESTAGHRIRSC